MVDLLPVTLRAWERRYGLPSPKRGDQGYRLYSEYDVRTLRWLKNQIISGMSISRAAEHLQELRDSGQDPASITKPIIDQPFTVQSLSNQFLVSLMHFDDSAASDFLRRAFSLYPLDQVLMEVIRPALVEIGAGWHRGEISIAIEHFAVQFCLQHLMSMLASSAPPTQPGLVIAACAPGEQHEIGLLMLVVMLRWRGHNVRYLGPNLPLEDLGNILAPLNPRLLLFSATRPETAQALRVLPEVLHNFPSPRPAVVLGGQAFLDPSLKGILPYPHMDGIPTEIVRRLESMIS